MQALSLLAWQLPDPRSNWAPVLLLLIMGIGFAVTNVIASIIIGPSRQGSIKSQTYESGMVPVGDTRKRFNVRFYILAMIFLVIDVDIIFFYPWATIFPQYTLSAAVEPWQKNLLLIEMLIFVGLLVVAYVYAWGKGIFRWD
jgi:NADH-quinone oxidoreductase subunit A